MLSFEKSPAGYYIVRTSDGRAYQWKIYDFTFRNMTASGKRIEITHNHNFKAVLSVYDDTGYRLLIQEINPLSHAERRDWVVDHQLFVNNQNAQENEPDVIEIDDSEDPVN